MSELVIIGTGDHARVALDTARALGLSVRAFLEPAEHLVAASSLAGIPIERDMGLLRDAELSFVVSVGNNRIRAELFERALAFGRAAHPLIHPSVRVLSGVTIGEGTHICAGAILGVDAQIGRNAIVNTAATIDHDNVIGDHTFVGPRAALAGRAVVGQGAHIGIGAVVLEGLRIGPWSLVAAGAVVIADVATESRVAGVPARPMRPSEEPTR